MLDQKISSNYIKNNVKKPILVFWFEAPPRASSGVFRVISQKWGNDVYYFCVTNLRKERINFGWKDSDHGNAKVVILSDLNNIDNFLKDFMSKNVNAIHIINGFRSKTFKYIRKYLLLNENSNIAVWSERPVVFGNIFMRIIRYVGIFAIYHYYYLKYSSKVKVYLPLGSTGVDIFRRFGWNINILYPFMYVPETENIESKIGKYKIGNKLRFLYVGRFDNSIKGLDILIQAFNKLPNKGWSLSMVGGYGKDSKKTIEWIERNPNVYFEGIWPSDKVCKKMMDYDVCIVSSKYDGWNVTINEAINAGIAVITSNQSVSHELIYYSGSGLIFQSERSELLLEALKTAINDPKKVEDWKKKARQYAPLISPNNIACYFIKVLEYIFLNNKKEKPIPPWIV